MDPRHHLDGTLHVTDAKEAETKARHAALDYFGDWPFVLDLSVNEIRTLGGQVLGYEVDFTASRTEEDGRER